MPKLARKVSLAKWRSPAWASIESIPADAVSIDLKTSGNTLSFWRAGGGDADSEEQATLALLGTLQRLDKMDIAFVDESLLAGINVQANPGSTAFTELRGLHVDLADLNHEALSLTAKALGAEVFSSRTRQLTRLEVKKRLQDALREGRIVGDSLPADLRKDLES